MLNQPADCEPNQPSLYQKLSPVTKIATEGLPKPEDLDPDGYCWWGWAANHAATNPLFWSTIWFYDKPPKKMVEKATHWAPHWAFPVLK